MNELNRSLRWLLSRRGSYAIIAAGQLRHFPVPLSEHVGDVYRRVEAAADRDCDQVEALRLAALVHEERPESLPEVLRAAGVSDLVPTVVAVTGAFGGIWKVRTEDDLRTYIEANRPLLSPILLFELAHEGHATPAMERAAELGGLHATFEQWAGRLTPPGLRSVEQRARTNRRVV